MAFFSEGNQEVLEANSNRQKINFLKKYKLLDQEINRLFYEIDQQRALLGKLTGQMDDMPKNGGSIYRMPDIDRINRIIDLEIKLGAKIDERLDLREKIEKLFEAVENDTERLLLYYRYIDGRTFEWIASTMGYHWRYIHKIHVRALSKIETEQ